MNFLSKSTSFNLNGTVKGNYTVTNKNISTFDYCNFVTQPNTLTTYAKTSSPTSLANLPT